MIDNRYVREGFEAVGLQTLRRVTTSVGHRERPGMNVAPGHLADFFLYL